MIKTIKKFIITNYRTILYLIIIRNILLPDYYLK
jgi:hypothetical protein